MKVPTVTSVDDDSRSRKRKDNSECGPESTVKYDLAGSFYDIQVSKPNATGCRSISFKNKKKILIAVSEETYNWLFSIKNVSLLIRGVRRFR